MMRLTNSATMQYQQAVNPRWQPMTRYERADELWNYYENNGVYDYLRLQGVVFGNSFLKSLRNPAARVVEWYAATVWAGDLETALPIETKNKRLIEAIEQLWRWSNFASVKQEIVRGAAVAGVEFVKVAQPEDESKRVYMQRLDSGVVTSYKVDERGYIIEARLDTALGDGEWQTEHWNRQRVAIYKHKKSRKTPLKELGSAEETALSAWDIDFVPIVAFPHMMLRGEPCGAFEIGIEKIDEVNRQASRLHSLLFRLNDATFALESNMMDGNGRPIPPPSIGSSTTKRTEDGDFVELGSEKLLKLPGMAKLTSLVPQMQYADALAIIEAQMLEIEADLPETLWHKLKSAPDLSGRAIRLIMSPARAKTLEVRGNHEQALQRCHMMALTIGQAIGAFDKGIGRYEKGDFEHTFAARPVLPLSRDEIAELAAAETDAGVPLTTSLRMSGWTDEMLAKMQQDKDAEQESQQQMLATAVLNAQAQMQAGGQSNGLEEA